MPSGHATTTTSIGMAIKRINKLKNTLAAIPMLVVAYLPNNK